MSLDYYLPNGMTNGDLADNHPDIHNSLFSVCSMMMACGVKVLDDKEDFLTRVAMLTTLHVSDHKRQPELLEFYARAFDVLEGMVTNVSPDTQAAFRKRMAENLERDAQRKAISAIREQAAASEEANV